MPIPLSYPVPYGHTLSVPIPGATHSTQFTGPYTYNATTFWGEAACT